MISITLFRPFRARGKLGERQTRGVAPGWFVAAPSGLKAAARSGSLKFPNGIQFAVGMRFIGIMFQQIASNLGRAPKIFKEPRLIQLIAAECVKKSAVIEGAYLCLLVD